MPLQPHNVRPGMPVRADLLNMLRRLLSELLFVGPGLRKRSTGSAVIIELVGRTSVPGGGSGGGRPFYPVDDVADLPDPTAVSINSTARVNGGDYAGTEYSLDPNGLRWAPLNRTDEY